MGNYERHCAACLKSHGAKILLQQDPSGFWACPRCGLVNEGTTSARALVDFNEHGIQVDDDVMEIKNPRWSDWREAKFEVSACSQLCWPVTNYRIFLYMRTGTCQRPFEPLSRDARCSYWHTWTFRREHSYD